MANKGGRDVLRISATVWLARAFELERFHALVRATKAADSVGGKAMGTVLNRGARQDSDLDLVGQWVNDNRGALATLGMFYFEEGHKDFEDWSQALLKEIPEHHGVTAEHLRDIWAELSGEGGAAGQGAVPQGSPDTFEEGGPAKGFEAVRMGLKRVLKTFDPLPNRIAAAVLAMTFLYFIYPTPYEYARDYPYVIRVNRFTGRPEFSTPSGWAQIRPATNFASVPGSKSAPEDALKLALEQGLQPATERDFLSALQIVHFENFGSGVSIAVQNVGQETTPALKLRCSLLSRDGKIVDSGQALITAPLKVGDTAEAQVFPTALAAEGLVGEVASVRVDSAKASL